MGARVNRTDEAEGSNPFGSTRSNLMLFRRPCSYPAATRERARELRRAGFTYSEIIAELGGDIPYATLQSWVADIELTIEQQARIGHRQYAYSPETRERARELRRDGLTYSEIIAELGGEVPQATLQGWVTDIELTEEQRARIKQKEIEAARRGQPLGALWNRQQKQKRLQAARDQAIPIAKRLAKDRDALMLMASALYIGEGAKADGAFSFSNSDPQVIQTWMALLRRNFDIDEHKFSCYLAISEGMDEDNLKGYWSEVTGISLNQFRRSSVKKNPGTKKREGYKGVCIVTYYSAAVRRFLDALAQGVIDELLESA